MLYKTSMDRRGFLRSTGLSLGSLGSMALTGCDSPPEERYSQTDIDGLTTQRQIEEQTKGKGPYGLHQYQGYRGLAELPWFDLNKKAELICVDETVPRAIDMHCHLGMSMLFKPDLDLLARTDRVMHLLDCDGSDPGCLLDLDIYINGNFSEAALDELQQNTLAQALWGSRFAKTQTLPNLLAEMDSMRVQTTLLLPIKLGLPFGDTLFEDWHSALSTFGDAERFHLGASVHPEAANRIEQLRYQAKHGARVVKLHPTVQRFYPDDPMLMEIYEEAERLGLVIFFHGGRAGIEPESSHPYAMPRHYEAPLVEFPNLQFVLGHAGARDHAAMLDMALRHENAWLEIHGQSLTNLEMMIQRTNGERMLFGTDWPFYHIGASLAKVLIATDSPGRAPVRQKILRDNALRLLPDLI